MKIFVEFDSDDTNDDFAFEEEVKLFLEDWFPERYKITAIIKSGDITLDIVETAVCSYIGCEPEELQILSRKREIVEARQLCHFLSKKYTSSRLFSIGFRFGHKDHATVLHSAKTVTTLLANDKDYIKRYSPLIKLFEDGKLKPKKAKEIFAVV